MEFGIVSFVLLIILILVLIYLFVKIDGELNAIKKKSDYEIDATNERFEKAENQFLKSITDLRNRLKTLEQINNNEYEKIKREFSESRVELQLYVHGIKAELNLRMEEVIENQSQNTQNLTEQIDVSVATIKTELYERINNNFSFQIGLIKKLEEIIKNDKIENYNLIKSILNTLSELNNEYLDLKEKVNFFAGIEEDSKKLNDVSKTVTGIKQETDLIEKAILELSRNTQRASLEHKVEENENSNEESDDIVVEKEVLTNIPDDNVDEEETTYNIIDDIVKEETIDDSVDDIDLDDEKVPSILDENQKEAFKIMTYRKDNLLIAGRAGTGKSLLLNIFSKVTNKKTLVLAPTGIAALNVGGATLHSTFGFKNLVELNVADISESTIILNNVKKEVLRKVDTIIIDEISMLRSDVLEKINKILQCLNKNDRIFGGKQMIFIGDPFQLPPVVRKNEEHFLNEQYGGEYFFLAPIYKEADFKFVELTVNHRQESDPMFFDILNHIREGKLRNKDLDLLNSRVIDMENDKSLHRVIRLFATKNEVEVTNNQILNTIFGKEYEFECQIEYSKYDNQHINIENNFPFPQVLKLKIGANVMFISNDKDKRWVNGTIGIVKSISSDVIQVVVNDKVINVERVSFSQKDAVYSGGKIKYENNLVVKQFPIILSYAITIHKSQGMTYPNIACDISNCFEFGQEYVALSRTISLNGLHLIKPISGNNISVSPKVSEFYRNSLISADEK